MFYKDKFHNQLALNLGYERLLNDKRIILSVDESEEPRVTLKILGKYEIEFKTSGNTENVVLQALPEMQNDLSFIFDAIHQAYSKARNCFFPNCGRVPVAGS